MYDEGIIFVIFKYKKYTRNREIKQGGGSSNKNTKSEFYNLGKRWFRWSPTRHVGRVGQA